MTMPFARNWGLVLSGMGYDVVCVLNGHEALKKLDDDAEGFRALITDTRFESGVQGWQIAQSARMLNPVIHVVYISDDFRGLPTKTAVPGGVKLHKPFRLETIIRTIVGFDSTNRFDFRRLHWSW